MSCLKVAFFKIIRNFFFIKSYRLTMQIEKAARLSRNNIESEI